MSRANYSEDWDDPWATIRWRGAVRSAIRGKRGQAFLRDLLCALEGLPQPRLIANDLEREGEVCAIGALGKARGIDMSNIDPEDAETVAGTFGIADALAREVVYENDEGTFGTETPEQRYLRMKNWVERHLIPTE